MITASHQLTIANPLNFYYHGFSVCIQNDQGSPYQWFRCSLNFILFQIAVISAMLLVSLSQSTLAAPFGSSGGHLEHKEGAKKHVNGLGEELMGDALTTSYQTAKNREAMASARLLAAAIRMRRSTPESPKDCISSVLSFEGRQLPHYTRQAICNKCKDSEGKPLCRPLYSKINVLDYSGKKNGMDFWKYHTALIQSRCECSLK